MSQIIKLINSYDRSHPRQRSLRDIFTNVFLLLKYGGSERSFVRWRGFVPLWNVLWVSDWLKKKTLSWRMQVWHSREFLFSVSNQFSSNCYFQTWQQRRILYSCIYPGFSFNFWFGTGRKTSSILLGWIFMNTKFERELLKIRDHLRFLVNQNQSSRYKTTTIPHFANIKPWQVTKFYCGDMTGQPSGACQK